MKAFAQYIAGVILFYGFVILALVVWGMAR